MSMQQETSLLIQNSADKIAEALTRIDTSISASNNFDTLNLVSAAVAALAAAAAAYFALRSLKQQSQNNVTQYMMSMLATNRNMQGSINDFAVWAEDHKDFLEKISKQWPKYTISDDERKEMDKIRMQSANLCHFFLEIYNNHRDGFLEKKHIRSFKKLRAYALFQNYGKQLSKQFYKDFDPNPLNPNTIDKIHKWIDDLEAL
jgi:hypothetical protein